MDLNAAGLLREENGFRKLQNVDVSSSSDVFSDAERDVVAYAEAMTREGCDVSDELVGRIRETLSDAELVTLTAWIALENFYSRFNRAFGIDAQGFCIVPTEDTRPDEQGACS